MGRNRVNRNTKSAEIMQLKFGLAHHVIAKESLHRFGVLCIRVMLGIVGNKWKMHLESLPHIVTFLPGEHGGLAGGAIGRRRRRRRGRR